MVLEKAIQRGGNPPFSFREWNNQRWPSFSKVEMSCYHCGAFYDWPEFMDRLQRARNLSGRPFRIHSAHRCALHNARVGGAPLSQHLKLAVDIGLQGHDPRQLYQYCRSSGFNGFGFYTSFLHIDLGRERTWYGNQKAKKIWQVY